MEIVKNNAFVQELGDKLSKTAFQSKALSEGGYQWEGKQREWRRVNMVNALCVPCMKTEQ
jgi:hypothetical protein